MELFFAIAVMAILIQTTYLTIKDYRPKQKGDIILDTSVLIDGRIVSIARSGMLTARVVIPRSVLRELQTMADKGDTEKRDRARFGLDIANDLRNVAGLDYVVLDDGDIDDGGVDERLIKLARQRGSRICTVDYNLNKIARAESIVVLNINELAHALRMTYLPGERFDLELREPGQNADQAVGFLSDGTMVVVDHAKRHIGSTQSVEVVRAIQTEAGRMVFAKLTKNEPNNRKSRQNRENVSTKDDVGRQAKTAIDRSKRRFKRSNSNEDSLVDLANSSR